MPSIDVALRHRAAWDHRAAMFWWRARLMEPWQAQFLAYLGKTANVSAAARFADQPRSVVYECRKREAAFAAAWLQALEEAADRLEMEALRRAVDGVTEDKFYQGAVVGEFTRYSDTLPGVTGLNAVSLPQAVQLDW